MLVSQQGAAPANDASIASSSTTAPQNNPQAYGASQAHIPASSPRQPTVHIPRVQYQQYYKAQDRSMRHTISNLIPPLRRSSREFKELKPALTNAVLTTMGEYAMTAPTTQQPELGQLVEMGQRYIPSDRHKGTKAKAREHIAQTANEMMGLAPMYLSPEGRMFPAASEDGITYKNLGWDGPIIRNGGNGGIYDVPGVLPEQEYNDLYNAGVRFDDERTAERENLLGQGTTAKVRVARNLSVDPDSASIEERFSAIRIADLDFPMDPHLRARRERTHVAIIEALPQEEGFFSTRESAILRQEVGTRIFPKNSISTTNNLGTRNAFNAIYRIMESNWPDPVKHETINTILVRIILRIKRLHSMNPPIFHCDIKLDNFVVLLDGSIVPVDYTASKRSRTEIEFTGTAGHLDPYVLSHEYTKTHNEAIDQFALGCLLNDADHGYAQPEGMTLEQWEEFGGYNDRAEGIEIQGNTYAEAGRLLTQREPSERISLDDLLALPCFEGPLLTNEELSFRLQHLP